MAYLNIFYLIAIMCFHLISVCLTRAEEKRIIWNNEKRWKIEGGKFNPSLKPHVEKILSLINYDQTQNMNIIDYYNQRIEENEEVDQLPNMHEDDNK